MRHHAIWALAALTLTACPVDETGSTDTGPGGGLDGGADAAQVDQGLADLGAVDLGLDASPDLGPDGGPDAQVDAGPDAQVDAGPDASVSPDMGPDMATDAGPMCPPVPGPVAPAAPNPPGGCDGRRFFIELPVGVPDMPPGFTATLTQQLNLLAAEVPSWTCDPNDQACLITVSLAPAQVRETLRARRAWTVEFGAPIRPEQLCNAISGIRARANSAQMIALASPELLPMNIGRDCPVVPLGGVGESATEAMLYWHLDALYAAPADPPDLVGPNRVAGVKVVVVDTGVAAPIDQALEVEHLRPETTGVPVDAAAALHPHGTAMALLVRQVSPDAEIFSLRVLNEHGIGAISDLASALDAIDEDDRFDAIEGPTIVNLSIGWPPELAQPRTLSTGDCTTTEDPAGESVRAALDVLHARAAAGEPIVVLAAAGNRPGRAEHNEGLYRDWFNVATDGGFPLPVPDPCFNQPPPPSGPAWFYPAEWNRRATCDGPPGNPGPPRYLAWAVGGVNARQRATVVSIAGPPPPVSAPGEHVYVAHPMAPPPVNAPQCGPRPAEPNIVLPRAMTGTSVPTALTAGALAQVQSRRLARGQTPLAWAALEHLAWATGWEIGPEAWAPTAMAGVSARHLSLCGLERADMRSLDPMSRCADLEACLNPPNPRPAIVDRAFVEACADIARECLDEDPCDAPLPQQIGWPPNYVPQPLCDDRGICPEPWIDTADCEGPNAMPGCPHEVTIDRHSAGTLAPQPITPGCPDCGVSFDAQGHNGILWGEIEPSFHPATVFLNPQILLRYPVNGATKKVYLSVPQPSAWQPGDTLKVSGLPNLPGPVVANPKIADVTLVTVVVPPQGNPSLDFVPLRLTVD